MKGGFLEEGGVWGTALSLTKATLGTGVLVLGLTARSVGIPLLSVLLVVGAFFTVKSVGMLSRSCELTGKWSYNDLADDLYGSKMAIIVSIAMVFNCYGSAVGYIIAIGDGLQWVFQPNSKEMKLMQLAITTGILLPLACIRKISKLRYFSFFGVLGVSLIVIAAIYIIIKDGVHETIKLDPNAIWSPAILNISSIMNAFSTISFSFVCQYNVPHLYNELKTRNPKMMTSVSIRSVSLSLTLYLIAGICGYLALGLNIHGSILSNIQPYVKKGEIYPIIATIGCVISVCVAHALQTYPIRQTFEYGYKRILQKDKSSIPILFSMGVSCLIVYLSYLNAILLPSLKSCIQVVGAIGASAVAYIFPPLFEIKLIKKKREEDKTSEETQPSLWLHYLLLTIGAISGTVGTYFAIDEAIKTI
jgi:amino acid permease